MNIRVCVLRLCLIVLLVASAPGRAQNLLLNSTFDLNLGGWSSWGASGMSATRDIQDADGSTASGSAFLTNIAPLPSTTGGIAQCVPVRPNVSYVASMKTKVPGGTAAAGHVSMQVTWWSSVNCLSGQLPSPSTPSFTPPANTWTTVAMVAATAPANAVTVSLSAFIYKTNAGGSYSAWVDDLSLMPASTLLTIPASASIHGVGTTFFHTDLWILNNSPENAAVVTLRHRCPHAQTCAGGTKTVTIGPRGSTCLPDVIGSYFGDPGTSGVIELSFDPSVARITAGSRTYTPTQPEPTNGTAVPALPSSAARTRSVFWGLSANGGNLASGFRSNAGAYNPSGDIVFVTFSLYDSSGAPAGSQWGIGLNPYESFQIDVFKFTKNTSVVTTNHYLVATSTAPVFSYVTVVDNQTGDTTWIDAAYDQ